MENTTTHYLPHLAIGPFNSHAFNALREDQVTLQLSESLERQVNVSFAWLVYAPA
jgi:hypothetical protein